MAKGLITQQHLEDIADAIRGRNNSLTEYKPSEMAAAISAIPNSYTAGDEGKVVKNGALVAQTARAAAITENGTYDTTENNEVTVYISGSSAVVQPLSVTQNGTYNPPSGVDGYAPVTVNVPSGGSSDVEYWDLSDSLIGTLRGIISTASNVTIESTGAVFASNSAIRFCVGWNGMTIEIETGNLQLTQSGNHRRFVMIGAANSGNGFIYRSTGKWAFYTGTWVESTETDGSFFDNCLVKIHIDNTGHWHIYKDGVLFWEPSAVLSADYSFIVIGTTAGGIIGTIKSVRIY